MIAILRLLLWFVIIFSLVPFQILAVKCRSALAYKIPPLFHKASCFLFGIRIKFIGEISTQRPILFVSNHSSYLDILVLGGALPGCFIAKDDVAGWPVIGFLAKLQRTIFVRREPRFVKKQRQEIQTRLLTEGDNLILFPEGTTNDGQRVLPFKSSLFGAVIDKDLLDQDIYVQPVSTHYTKIDGLPVTRFFRPLYTWDGETDLASHLWRFLQLGRTEAVILLHDALPASQFGDRKVMAETSQRAVSNGIQALIRDRDVAPVKGWQALENQAKLVGKS